VVTSGHWRRWHLAYDDLSSPLSKRLGIVQRDLANALDEASEGPIRVISMCAGQGRDVIGVLAGHRRRGDVVARLVELDPILAADAAGMARSAGLRGVEVVEGDASNTSAYAGAVPADVVLVCGVFGNITDADIRRTIRELHHLCAPGATVVWTRHRAAPDLTSSIRAWFGDAGFVEIAFDTDPVFDFGVGAALLSAPPRPFRPGRTMFTFIGDGAEAHQ